MISPTCRRYIVDISPTAEQLVPWSCRAHGRKIGQLGSPTPPRYPFDVAPHFIGREDVGLANGGGA